MSTPKHRDNRSHRTNRRFFTLLFVLLVLVMSIATSASAGPSGSSDFEKVNASSIWLDGPVQAIRGELISYNITTDVTGLFGAQLELRFDPAVLQVVGTKVTPGSCPQPDFVVTNSVDNGVGSISYAVVSLNPTLPCDGGIVASFQFQVSPAAALGTTQVQFDSVLLADINGTEIPVTAIDLADLEVVNSIWLEGPNQAAPGDEISYNITAAVTGLFGVQLELGFDPAVLQFAGTKVTPGSCPVPDFVVLNSFDNVAGSIAYAVTSKNPTLPCDGGIVASFKFQVSPAAAAGATQVPFDSVMMADINGTEIPVTAVDLDVEITDPLKAEFSGTPTVGLTPLTVNFTNLSSGDIGTCLWEFGDGDSDNSCGDPTHTYTFLGNHDVSLTINGLGGASDTETKIDYIIVTPHLAYLPIILR